MRSSMLRSPPLALVVAALALATACGDDEGNDADVGGTTSTTETTTAVDTTAVDTTVVDTTVPSSTTPDDVGDAPAFATSGPSGSGCTPGDGELPDGWWYGVSVGLEPGPDPAFTFDLACYFVGDAAYAEGERRGEEVTNDYLVVNENPTVRTVPLAAGATATCVEVSDTLVEEPCDPTSIPDPETPWAVWFRVVDGEVDRLVEQYAP